MPTKKPIVDSATESDPLGIAISQAIKAELVHRGLAEEKAENNVVISAGKGKISRQKDYGLLIAMGAPLVIMGEDERITRKDVNFVVNFAMQLINIRVGSFKKAKGEGEFSARTEEDLLGGLKAVLTSPASKKILAAYEMSRPRPHQ